MNAIASAAALFITYRLAFKHLGAETLGLWALLSAILAFARISDSGATTAMLRQVGLARQREREPKYITHFLAGLTVATLPTLILAALLASVSAAVALNDVRLAHLPAGIVHLTAFASFVFAVANSAAGVASGCLDGSGQLRLRVLICVVGNALQIFVAAVSVGRYGLIGFAIAQWIPPVLLLFLSIPALLSKSKTPLRYSELSTAIRSCLSFTSGSILLGLARTGFEPATKFFIGYYGGLPAVAVFDLANRVSAQLRQIITAALQPFAISAVRNGLEMTEDLSHQFWRWTLASFGLALGAAAFQIATSPLISLAVIGETSHEHLVYSSALAFAMFINASGNASFFTITSAGRLAFLQVLHVIMLLANLALGYALALLMGSVGAVLAWSLVFSLGGAAVLFRQVRYARPPDKILQRALIATTCGGSALLGFMHLVTSDSLDFISKLLEAII